MVDFSDVMRFAETHRACGSVAPAVTPQPSGGYLLTLTCACGAFLDRRVTADEAMHAPFLAGVPPSPPPAPGARRAPATPAAPPTRAVAASAAELEPRKPASAKRAAGPARTANVAETVRAALREQERLRDDLTKAAAPDRPRSRTMWLSPSPPVR